jgi:hypothetical protein
MMLRTGLLLVAVLVFAAGGLAWLAGEKDGAPFALWGGVVAIAVLAERWRYRTRAAATDDGWEATEERFIDPESGQALQVFYNPHTGERRYGADEKL